MSNNNTVEVIVTPMHSQVTGSCFYVRINVGRYECQNVIVDCGIFQGREQQELNNISYPKYFRHADKIFLTHNHADHMGRVPELVRNGFHNKIHCTPLTYPMLEFSWLDCVKIEKCNARIEGRPVRFQRRHVAQSMDKILPYAYNKRQKVSRYVYATFLPNAHLVGAAMLLLEVINPDDREHPINLLFSGDYNTSNYFVDIPDIPKEIREMPINLITECTYGLTPMDYTRVCVFEENVSRELAQGKQVLIPVFACERGQIVLSTLKRMQDTGKIDKNIPIFVDGTLFKTYTKYYSKIAPQYFKDGLKNFIPANYIEIPPEMDRKRFMRNYNPFVLVATSGMASFGPVVEYMKAFITNPRTAIHFTGYQTEGSRGRRLINAYETGELAEVYGTLMPVRCKVYSTSEFSSHALPCDLLEYICKFENMRSLSINHGSDGARNQFARLVLDAGITEEVINLKRFGQYHYSANGLERVHFIQTAFSG